MPKLRRTRRARLCIEWRALFYWNPPWFGKFYTCRSDAATLPLASLVIWRGLLLPLPQPLWACSAGSL